MHSLLELVKLIPGRVTSATGNGGLMRVPKVTLTVVIERTHPGDFLNSSF